MSAPVARRDRRRRAARTPRRFLLTQALLLDAVLLVGAAASWAIYRSTAFVVLIGVSLAAGHAIALLGRRARWSPWWVALAVAVAYVVLGLPIAAPTTLVSVPDALRGLVAVLVAPATGWKDLLTLDLPLGAYQATLAPALLVFLAATAASLSVAWRAPRLWALAVPIALVPTAFGIGFGSTALAPPLTLAGVPVAVETLLGAAALVASLAAIVWRTVHERRRAVAAAVAATGVRSSGGSARGLASRIALATSMVAAAALVGMIAAPAALAGHTRDVLRSGVDPRLEIAEELSPLARYRADFADDRFDETLFTVTAPTGVDRVRLATLSFYDGQVARVVDPAAGSDDPRTAFRRILSVLPAPAGSESGITRIRIEGYDQVWLPTAGAVTSLSFTGERATAWADGFFYNAETSAGVELADPGLSAGATYAQGTAARADLPAVASLEPARDGSALPDDVVPESVRTWIEAQSAPEGGAGLESLVDTLRARGFLSHALTFDPGEVPAWAAALGDYSFQPSRAGHSTDRIDGLFSALNARQNEIGGDDDAALVSAVGDDEQFAVAAMLIADQLGFDARVVVGTRLTSADPTLSTCADGACTGGDVAAWIEVRGNGPDWVPLDVTPQAAAFPSPDTEQRRDPQNPTEVQREQAETVLPAETNPTDGGDTPPNDSTDAPDLAALWATVRIGGLSLLALVVLVGPFAIVLALKALRRRDRRRSPDVVDRLTGGWQEYVDTAVDHGYGAPRSLTRQELATLYAGGTDAARLATLADRSVFDASPPSEAESEEFWRIVDAERARFAGELGWWSRLSARLSLRSILRRSESSRRTEQRRAARAARQDRVTDGGGGTRRTAGEKE